MLMRDIDVIIGALIQSYPDLSFWQLTVMHPADDDGIWYFEHPSCPYRVKLESSYGTCPFIFETTADATFEVAETVPAAIRLVIDGLGLAAA
jgi:hypothetical protein